MSVNEKMTAIADAIRAYGHISGKLNLDDMANKIGTVYLEGIDDGYEGGLSEGRTQGYALGFEEGKAEERKAFFDVFQKGGTAGNYYYAYAVGRFTDDNYNPEHDIVISEGTTTGRNIFYNSPGITDTKVAIYAPSTNIETCFAGATNLKFIRKLVLQETTGYTNTFNNCTALEELNVEGVIGKNGFNVQWSTLLNKASIESIINALSDTTTGLTVTLSKIAVNNAFTADEWSALEGSKSNWTISLL